MTHNPKMINNEKILLAHKIKPTKLRLMMLEALLNSRQSFSCTEMNSFFGGRQDRVTIYRFFCLLDKAGLVNKSVDSDGVIRYHYGRADSLPCPSFRCRSCGLMVELDPLPEKYHHNLSQFKVDNIVLSFTGLCSDCK